MQLLPVFRPPCVASVPTRAKVLDRVSTAGEAKPLMSKGFGKIQRSIAALIRAEPDGAWAYEHLTERIYGTYRFTRAQKNAVGRALAHMRLPGTWEVWQATSKTTGDSGCSTPATSRAGARSYALGPRELSARRRLFRLV